MRSYCRKVGSVAVLAQTAPVALVFLSTRYSLLDTIPF